MILADKIITERKKNGWSQEELAEKIGVTRQAVSKWEGAQTVPDLQKLLLLSNVFGVPTDYLLKDELETPDYSNQTEETCSYRKVTFEEAVSFLQVKKKTTPKIAYAVLLCIYSPVSLILLAALAKFHLLSITEDAACGIGLMILFLMVAIACAIFISCGAKTKHFEFLEKEPIETDYGITGMVKERKKAFQETYTRYNILGTVTCILGILPLFTAMILDSNDLFSVFMLCLLFVIEGIGVRFFILAGIPMETFDKLLQDGDYTIEAKTKSSFTSTVSTAYWLIITAVFLSMTLSTNEWSQTIYIWPVAGILFPAVLALVKYFDKN